MENNLKLGNNFCNTYKFFLSDSLWINTVSNSLYGILANSLMFSLRDSLEVSFNHPIDSSLKIILHKDNLDGN